jgi:hypothetical protein
LCNARRAFRRGVARLLAIQLKVATVGDTPQKNNNPVT